MAEQTPAKENTGAGSKPLSALNFKLMAAAAVMIIVGFLLMGGSSSGMQEYNPDIFSMRRIVVGPTIAFLGYIALGVAIMIKKK